jgi:hypothetical protein
MIVLTTSLPQYMLILWKDPVLFVKLPLIKCVDFNVDMWVLGANALREVKLNDAIVIGTQPSADGVQHYFQAAVKVSLERSGEVALKVQSEVASTHTFYKGCVQYSLLFQVEQGFLYV